MIKLSLLNINKKAARQGTSIEKITHSQVQELIKRLPAARLPLAYNLLSHLAEDETSLQSPQLNFMLLPVNERRRILAQQAEQMIEHYEQSANEREAWQSGDLMNEQNTVEIITSGEFYEPGKV